MLASGTNRLLLLFTKPERPGRVKTRLIGALTPEEAAELHAAFRDDLIERLAKGRFELAIAWAIDRDESMPPSRIPGVRQLGRDLGERLHHALAVAARNHAVVAAVGSDHPLLEVDTVEQAFGRVERGADVALGPATDGGYYLIAVRGDRLSPGLFEAIAWSTGAVLEQTLERCRELGLTVDLLPEGADVDTPADLERLAREIATDGAPTSPRTRALLAGWGRLATESTR